MPFKRFFESDLLHRISAAKTAEERERCIAELENQAVIHFPFYERWMLIHNIEAYASWDDVTYDPKRSPLPRDIQIFWATHLSIADIKNGGMHQYFGNPGGRTAPEVVEWFERSGMQQSANLLKQGMAIFGEPFPRTQSVRGEFIDDLTDNPFDCLDEPFFERLARRGNPFEDCADRWLRDACGITNLRDPPKLSTSP